MLSGHNGPSRLEDWLAAAGAVADVVGIASVPALTLPPVPRLAHAGRDPGLPHRYEVAVAGVSWRTAGRIAALLRFEAAECGRIDVLHAHVPGAGGLLPRLARASGIPYVLTAPAHVAASAEPPAGRLARLRAARANAGAAVVAVVPYPVDPGALPPVPARARIGPDPVRVAVDAGEDWAALAGALAEAHAKDGRLRLHILDGGAGPADGLPGGLPGGLPDGLPDGFGARHWVTRAPGRGRAGHLHDLAHADLFVTARHDRAAGLAVLDALSCGTPVVGPAAGPLPALVRRDGGILVPPADPHALAHGLLQAAAVLTRHRPAVLADRTRRRFGPAAVGARLAELYAEASGSGSVSGRPSGRA
jgi:glycosyltransferase involved in cell wall biosynthesis